MRYTIKWVSNRKNVPIIWEKYEHEFPRFSPYDEFCCIFPYYEKLMGKPIHFPYAEVYHRMGVGWEKSTHTMGKVWLLISQTFPISWVLLHFLVLWEIYGETHAFPIWWHRLTFSCVSDLVKIKPKHANSKSFYHEKLITRLSICNLCWHFVTCFFFLSF